MCSEFHLYLEGISFEANLIQLYCLKQLTLIAYKSSSGVMDIHAQDKAHIFAREITHQYASHWPVHHIHTRHIATTNSQVRTIIRACIIQLKKVVWIMTKVRIHLKDIIGLVLYSPFESSNIRRTQSLFARALHQVYTSCIRTSH